MTNRMSAFEKKFAMIGAGFWARYQLAGWGEQSGVRCVAVCDQSVEKATQLAERAGLKSARIYTDARRLFESEKLDFVDIVTNVETHAPLVHLAASHKVAAICQKPLARTLAEAQGMRDACRDAGVPLLVHENWRWQAPLRRLGELLAANPIGRVFRMRIQWNHDFPVFDNQPALKLLEQFMLTDMGTHIFDIPRFLFGEAKSIYCQTQRIHADIRGEDVATVMLGMETGVTVTCEMSCASPLERSYFPQTLALVEGAAGSIELTGDYWLRVTCNGKTVATRHPPPRYGWVDPDYAVAQSSVVACQQNLLEGLRGTGRAETTADDNLKTLELVFAAYESAATGRAVAVNQQRA